jgi:hypothetical protein
LKLNASSKILSIVQRGLPAKSAEFANIFANELFTTIKNSDLAVQIEAKSPIKGYQELLISTLRDMPFVSFNQTARSLEEY